MSGARRRPGARPTLAIGPLRLDSPFVMAPMADVTDAVFHEMLRELGGPGLYTAEMVSSRGLSRGEAAPRRLLTRPRGCSAFAVQVYGADPDEIAAAACEAVDHGADLVDVNMGCPAKKITGRSCGSALLRDLGLVRRILERVRAALPEAIPLTVKIRTGWDERRPNFLEVGRLAEGLGLSAITLHGRSRNQMFRGEADWSAVAELKGGVGIPVVGNGDVTSAGEALERLRESGCDGVMIGRGALANPWIFRQLRDRTADRVPAEPTASDRRRVILRHHERLAEALPPPEALHRLRKFVGYYLGGVERGHELRRRLSELRDGESLRAAVDAFFASLEARGRAAA